MSLNNVTVYCGACSGKDPAFIEGAKALGECFLKHDIGLVYGAGNTGMMGAISKVISDGGGKVTGVIPQFFLDTGISENGNGEVIVMESMHQRKKFMSEKGDAFIALPGGFGTMEELVEIITWVPLGLHSKPIGILNTKNYYKGFLEWISHGIEQEYIPKDGMDIFVVSDDPEELVNKLRAKKASLVNSPKQ